MIRPALISPKPVRVGCTVAALCLAWVAASASPDSNSIPTLDSDPHLAGWWPLDETSGSTAADASVHGRHAAAQGGMTLDKPAPGKQGGALAFEGKDGFLQVTGYKGVTGTGPRTVAAWIKTPGRSGEIISWGSQDFGKMWTFGFIRSRIGVTPKGGYLYMRNGTDDDAWHHVAAVVEEAAPPNLHDHVTLYLDGEPAVIHDIGLLDLWPIDTGDALDVRIGQRFQGLLDDVRLYNRALSEEEIQALFRLDSKQPSAKPR